MAVLRIVKFDEKILRKKTRRVDMGGMREELLRIVKDMFETMDFAGGMGLSANQVGIDLRLTVIRNRTGENAFEDYVLINPEITEKSGVQVGQEGCLSFPGLFLEVKRFGKVKVRALNLEGSPVEIAAEGLLARALQHEIDHLDGISFVERLPLKEKMKLKPRLRELRKEWKEIDESALARRRGGRGK